MKIRTRSCVRTCRDCHGEGFDDYEGPERLREALQSNGTLECDGCRGYGEVECDDDLCDCIMRCADCESDDMRRTDGVLRCNACDTGFVYELDAKELAYVIGCEKFEESKKAVAK